MENTETDAGAARRAKATVRAAARQIRLAAWRVGVDAGARLATRIVDELAATPSVRPAALVAGYWPLDDEIDVRVALHDLHDRGYALCLPVVVRRGEPLRFRRWRPQTVMVAGAFGVSIPSETEPFCVPEALLVPLLAFDRCGHRLGYGGGFYDRTLGLLRHSRPVTAIGVGFAAQEIAAVPCGRFDQPLDGVVTEAFSFWVRDAPLS